MNTYYERAAERNIQVLYNAEVVELDIQRGRFMGGVVVVNGQRTVFQAKSLVVASAALKQIWNG